ncbi:cupin domain-containing protein [Kitasatospora sp. NPDC059646]|uniref:cupin domain-containing protein n=1 Tax=Kitasatospora sp. NPDC059646 TaxID=3346893 RepID=UPI0036780FCB
MAAVRPHDYEARENALARSVQPLSVEDFLANYWQRAPLLTVRNGSAEFADIVDMDEFDAIIAGTGLRHPYFRIFDDGAPLPVGMTTTSRQLGPDLDSGLADLDAVYQHHANGATIVLQAMERWWPKFQQFCRDFELAFGFPTQAHAYLTPPHARGAPVHYDTHDVFVLQVQGSKRWRVWEPVKRLPMRMSEDVYEPSAVQAQTEEKQPLIDVELRAGDSLYLPRGYIHEVTTDRHRSLHVTVSVMVYRWADLAEAVISDHLVKLRDVVEYRESLPYGRVPFGPPDRKLSDHYAKLVDDFLSGLDLASGEELMRSRLVSYIAPSWRGRFLDVQRASELTLDQPVFVRSDTVYRISATESTITLTVGSTAVEFDIRFAPAIRHVVAAQSFTAGDLSSDLTDAERLDLTRRLVQLGLCTLGKEWQS